MAERGDAVGLLVAAEWPIYGRFGYGPAIDACGFDVDTRTARFLAEPSGTIELVMPSELRPELERRPRAAPAPHPRRASTRPSEVWDASPACERGRDSRTTRARSAARCGATTPATVQGAVAYKVEGHWERNRPAGKAEVTLLVGATPEAERELWRHLARSTGSPRSRPATAASTTRSSSMLADGRARRRSTASTASGRGSSTSPPRSGARRPGARRSGGGRRRRPAWLRGGRWSLELGPDGADGEAERPRPPTWRSRCAPSAPPASAATVATRLPRPAGSDERRRAASTASTRCCPRPTAPWSPPTDAF